MSSDIRTVLGLPPPLPPAVKAEQCRVRASEERGLLEDFLREHLKPIVYYHRLSTHLTSGTDAHKEAMKNFWAHSRNALEHYPVIRDKLGGALCLLPPRIDPRTTEHRAQILDIRGDKQKKARHLSTAYLLNQPLAWFSELMLHQLARGAGRAADRLDVELEESLSTLRDLIDDASAGIITGTECKAYLKKKGYHDKGPAWVKKELREWHWTVPGQEDEEVAMH